MLCLLSVLVSAPALSAQAVGYAQDNPPPTPLPDPVSSPLPPASQLPSTLWRPALYPVPWALSQNDHFFFIRPIAANKVNWPLPAYRYGSTNFGPNQAHTGVDIVADKGTPVIATGPGLIIWQGYGLFSGGEDLDDKYGLAIVIEHDFGYMNQTLYTVYAHLSRANVIRGQRVATGEVIGATGDTGNATGEHLHYEVRLGKNDYFHSFNPELWLSPPQGSGVLAARLTTSWDAALENLEIRVTNRDTKQRWYVTGYGTNKVVNGDPAYHENFVLSDLPAGPYEIFIPYAGRSYFQNLRIYPGAITFFKFVGMQGITMPDSFLKIPTNIPDYEKYEPDRK